MVVQRIMIIGQQMKDWHVQQERVNRKEVSHLKNAGEQWLSLYAQRCTWSEIANQFDGRRVGRGM